LYRIVNRAKLLNMGRLLKKGKFAELAGVSAGAISQLVKPGKCLHDAMAGKHIDIAHPAAVAYLSRHAAGYVEPHAPAAPLRTPATESPQAAPAPLPTLDTDIDALADRPFREVVELFGNDMRMLEWLKAMKALEDIRDKRVASAQKLGQLVARELVRRAVLDVVEEAHVKLGTDGAKTIARRIYGMAEAGRPVVDAERFARETIFSFVKPMKAKITRGLRGPEE
jgi:hypothetical protein